METLYELAFCICLAATCPEAPTESTDACEIQAWGPYSEETCKSVRKDVETFPGEGEEIRFVEGKGCPQESAADAAE